MTNKKIAILVPALNFGGFQRVSVVLANYYASKPGVHVSLISLSNREVAFTIDPAVKLIMPKFDVLNYSFIVSSIKTMWFLRKLYAKEKYDAILSFGDLINAMAVICGLGLKSPVFISNRQNPDLSNGFLIDTLNRFFFPFANGIIAQTAYAKKVFAAKYKHKNVEVIPNPFPIFNREGVKKEKIILNVGRFTPTKNQHLLLKYFTELNIPEWRLVFLGDGNYKTLFEEELKNVSNPECVSVQGFVKDTDSYYRKAAIFAFTTTSEGFPNALGEGMGYGCASISFNCIAGPSDLIQDGENGFLVENYDHDTYKEKLRALMLNGDLREKISHAGELRLKAFSEKQIAEKFYDFITTKK